MITLTWWELIVALLLAYSVGSTVGHTRSRRSWNDLLTKSHEREERWKQLFAEREAARK